MSWAILLLVLSVWDYPARYPAHDQLRRQFIVATREGDTATMEETCRKGVKLLPDDPTWHYNLACSLAYFPKRANEALDELEKAIDAGFRDEAKIASDTDLKRLSKELRYSQLIEYAKLMKTRPMMFGPMATVAATGIFGKPISLGEQNLGWDFDVGLFDAKLQLAEAGRKPNTGDLYVNRDGNHSRINLARFPGLTEVRFDAEGRRRHLDVSVPNTLYPYPVFGNCSMANLHPQNWRSLPRALVTCDAARLNAILKMYLSNQLWVFPSNADTPPVGTHGDVFASITPYWLVSAGRSYSDRPLLEAALVASAAFQPAVKAEIVKRGLLAPTIMTLMRKSLSVVTSEDEYTSLRAHPTAISPTAVSTNRLVKAAKAMTIAQIPPLAVIQVAAQPAQKPSVQPECIYMTAFAAAWVLQAEDLTRAFEVKMLGASEYRVVKTHGKGVDVKIEMPAPDVARIVVDKRGMNPSNRVDVAVFGRNPGTGWGAPSYISFAKMDPDAPYSDPFLTFVKDKVSSGGSAK